MCPECHLSCCIFDHCNWQVNHLLIFFFSRNKLLEKSCKTENELIIVYSVFDKQKVVSKLVPSKECGWTWFDFFNCWQSLCHKCAFAGPGPYLWLTAGLVPFGSLLLIILFILHIMCKDQLEFVVLLRSCSCFIILNSPILNSICLRAKTILSLFQALLTVFSLSLELCLHAHLKTNFPWILKKYFKCHSNSYLCFVFLKCWYLSLAYIAGRRDKAEACYSIWCW